MSVTRIIIIGASSGLGHLMAEYCAEMGWRVGVAARNESSLKALSDKYPGLIEWMSIDITMTTAPKKLQQLIDKLGGMDIYCHVSGILYETSSPDITEDIQTVETNVAGFTRMIDAAFHYFRIKGSGHIAAVTSVAGTKGIADLASYSASKRYQWNYIQALEQLAQRDKLNINFTDIRPGWTRTPLINPNRRYIMSMTPSKVAHSALRAIIRQKRVAIIDRRWALLAFFWRLLPSSIWVRLPLHASS